MQRSLGLLMATNFKLNDFFLTLTFDDEHLPRTRKEAMKAVKEFTRLLKRHRLLRKQDLKYIYCIESKHEAGRYHIHMVMNATGQDVEAILSLWSYGLADWEYIGWEKKHGKLKYRGVKGYEILARYMTKEVQPVGAKNYISSRYLVRPTVTVSLMSTDKAERQKLFQVPSGCRELEFTEVRNEFGVFRYLRFYDTKKQGSAWGRDSRPQGLYDGADKVISRR